MGNVLVCCSFRHGSSGEMDSRDLIISFTPSELKDYTDGFNRRNFLGSGGFGRVYLGTISGRRESKINGNLIAVKESRKLDGKTRLQWQINSAILKKYSHSQAEIDYLPRVRHQNVIKLIGYCDTPEKLCLVYPYMQNGTVASRLSGLDWKKTFEIIKGAASAIQELHHQTPPLIYRDLKLDNLLLDKNFIPCLADFGTVTAEGESLKLGTPGYTDPIVMSNGIGTKANDIYSLGVIILQLIMKEEKVSLPGTSMPWHISHFAITSRIHSEKRHVVHEKLTRTGCSKWTAELITELGLDCVQPKMSARPTIDEVLQRLFNLEGKHAEKLNLFDKLL